MDSGLRQRIVTALVLVSLLLPLLFFASPDIFALVMVPVFLCAFHEWSRLAGLQSQALRLAYVAVALVALSLLFLLMQAPSADGQPALDVLARLELLFAAASLFWVLAAYWVLNYPVSAKFWKSSPALLAIGWLVLLPAWVSLFYLKQVAPGGSLVFLAILVIAIADIGAYFAGRRWGKRKLAISVSPGKSWEGFWGGLCLNLLFALLLALYLGLSFPHLLLLVAVIAVVSIASVVGDLTESMIKREAGVKDSGTLLPGHGGVLDRIDGWTAAMPVIALAHLLFVQAVAQ